MHFGRLPTDERRAMARRGGLAAQATGRAHKYTSEEGRAAGRKGGLATAEKRRKARAELEAARERE